MSKAETSRNNESFYLKKVYKRKLGGSLELDVYKRQQYGWQAVFNTFGALAIATESYGLKGAISLRVIQNVFGVVFAFVFCAIFYWVMSKKEKRGDRTCRVK